MSRATKVLAGTTALFAVTTLWLYIDNESLRDDVATKTEEVEKATKVADNDEWLDAKKRDGKIDFKAPQTGPSLPDGPKESRLDRRVRRGEEFAAMFGREPGETEEEWRARVAPLITAGLYKARVRSTDSRQVAEKKAGVTDDQSFKINVAMEKAYGDLLDYTNKAVADGKLSPYERNVTGWLDYAGGLSGILSNAQGEVGKILTPAQVKSMYDSGFEWGEYLGANAPWEKIGAPPPRKN
jgi:hypothetical protein